MNAPARAASVGTAIGAMLIAGTAAAYAPVIENRGIQQAAMIKLMPPVVGSDWRPNADTQSGWRPLFFGASDEQLWFYARGDQEIEVYAAFYPYQRQDSEVVGWRARVTEGKVWQQLTTVDHTGVQLDGGPQKVRRTHLRKAGRQRLVLFWYWIDGRFVAAACE